MKNFLLSALVVLFAAFAGQSYAQSTSSSNTVSQNTDSVDQATMEQIYEVVSCETGKSLCEVREMEAHGELIVEQTNQDQYRVVMNDGGTLLDLIIEDDF